jgi:hypothetical protein
MPAQSSANRVEGDISRSIDQMLFGLDEPGAEPTVEEVSVKPMAPVEVRRIHAVQSMHSLRQVSPRRVEEQVKVVRHQAVLPKAPPIATKRSVLQYKEEIPVVIVVIDGLAAVASRRHVIEAAGELEARWSRHRPTLRAAD